MTVPAEGFELIIGLEVHVQLATKSKLFCGCATSFGDPPNVHTCPVCLALPGALPVLNSEAVTLAARAALALRCEVAEVSVFARKNYFYPDLPKGYQISQFDRPLATGGETCYGGFGEHEQRVAIRRVHLEEDAGKLLHDRFPGASAVDLNRSGVPLVEIVTEPDLRSSADTRDFLQQLRLVLLYTRVSDANMEEGSLRVDANVSVRPRGTTTLGTRTEIKNLNSFSAVERAIDAEYRRQCDLLALGGTIVQQTMLWDEVRGDVRPARSKEESHDYRYFPEPDLPPVVLDRRWIQQERRDLPELPRARSRRFESRFELPLNEARVLVASRELADYFEEVATLHGDGRAAATWMSGEVLAHLNEQRATVGELRVRPAELSGLLDLVRDGTVSRTAARQVFAIMTRHGGVASEIARREGLVQVSDEDQLIGWIDEVLAASPAEAERLRNGEHKLIGVFVGHVMKASGGRADPRRVNQLLRARLSG